jgi:hypothetical protein
MKKTITLFLLIISLALVLLAVSFEANAQSQERTAGSPIGGIVVKGGKTDAAVTEAKPGNPIGGIIVKGGHNGVTADVKATNPLYTSSGNTGQNPLYEGKSTGQPIGGIVVKGGQNEGSSSLVVVPDNGKSISTKGVKRN